MKFIRYWLILMFTIGAINAKEIMINFHRTPIVDVIKFVASKTKKNILINEPISGKINFISNKPIDESELLPFLEHVLKVKGYALSTDENGYLDIVRSVNLKQHATFSKSDSIGMQITILRPKYIKPSELLPKIKQLASSYAIITADDKRGIILISDYQKNIKKIKKVMHIFDTDTNKLMSMNRVELKQYNVKIALSKLQAIFNASKDNYKSAIKLIADEYQNALWVLSDAQDAKKAINFIKDFDANGEDSVKMATEIIFLKNANVEDILKTAQEIAKSKDVNKPIKSVITANKQLNALIISSTLKQIKELKELLTQLDIQRKQVFVKVHIYEISTNALNRLGIKWGIAGGAVSGEMIATSAINLGGSSFVLPKALAGNIDFGSVSKGLAIGALVDFLKQNGALEVVSEPDLLSINNVKSSVYVGKTQSILTSQATGPNVTDTTRNTYTREDIGLTLEVTPQIIDKNNVVLKIMVNNEDVDRSTPADKPTTTKRKVNTTVIVQNEDSIILGGLTRDTHSKTTFKVPLLGDIPLLGGVFRNSSEDNDKISTVMVVTPYIINNSKDLVMLQNKFEKIKRLEKKMAEKLNKNFKKLKKIGG